MYRPVMSQPSLEMALLDALMAWAERLGRAFPKGVAMDAAGAVAIIADTSSCTIRRLDIRTGTVTTIAGQTQYGSADGVGTAASFGGPVAVAVDDAGTFALVADWSAVVVRYLVLQLPSASPTPAPSPSSPAVAVIPVSTLAGDVFTQGNSDGTAARLSFVKSIVRKL